ncbi:hypothetical protein F4804DRAFT_304495 [Jackrogersella minutella]|nr:hypothetical protein F4804DRAFT_304495 [Jackrogersella minutella]
MLPCFSFFSFLIPQIQPKYPYIYIYFRLSLVFHFFHSSLSLLKAMTTDSPFLNLPPELRIIIYEYYVSDEGYIYHPRARKLRDTYGYPIDLSLMYTCRLVACEMDGIALRTNTITFSSFYLKSMAGIAWFQDYTLDSIHHIKQRMLRLLKPCFTEKLKSSVGQVYPQFMPILDNIDSDWVADRMGHAPSIIHKALDYTLNLASSHHLFDAVALQCETEHNLIWGGPGAVVSEVTPDCDALDSVPFEPWKIPTPADTRRSLSVCGFKVPSIGDRWMKMFYGPEKYCFSAAAASIQFLGSLPASTRAHIRRIVLHENDISVAYPECHALGLIPFCQENPRLRIERRVNLWTNVFLRPLRQFNGNPILSPRYHTNRDGVIRRISSTLTRSVALWTVEALELVPSGMPEGSFSLLLDGEPLPDECEQIFDHIIQSDVTWQAAMEESEARGFLPRFDIFQEGNMHRYVLYTFKNFPGAFNNISKKRKSIVRCNFYLRAYSTTYAEHLAENRSGWTVDMWRGRNWLSYRWIDWNTYTPFLEWMDLLYTAFGFCLKD